MKIIRFKYSDNVSYGTIEGEQITEWSDAPWAGGVKLSTQYSLDNIELLAPCQPGKIIATAINYPGATGLTEKANEPLVFIKPSTSVIASQQTIVSPFKDVPVWGECELGVVIGKKLSKANAEEAKDAVFGYTVGNDVSCDNVLGWDHHLARSKGADTFCVLGPWIDTNYDPDGKHICGYHNQTLLREGYCEQRLWKEPELLVWLSSWMTLEPGDVVLTGAPTRVRDRIYFKDGDSFTCSIEGLGEITNSFKGLYG